MSYDSKCDEIARDFLLDYTVPEPAYYPTVERIAQAVQNAIEGELSSLVEEGWIIEGHRPMRAPTAETKK